MRFCNLIPPFLMRFGTIPESYKLAMTYEEQLLWLCKYLEDMGTEIENIKIAINNIGVAVNALADNIEEINNDITDINQNHYLINILRDFISIDDFADNNVSGYYYTNIYRILKGDLEHLTEIAIPEDTLFFYDSENKYFKILSNRDDIFSQYILYDALTETWEYGEYRYTDYVGETSTSKQIPSAQAVYTAIQQGGGGGGTTDYDALTNKPSINGNTLTGNLTTSELGINDIDYLRNDTFNTYNLQNGIHYVSGSQSTELYCGDKNLTPQLSNGWNILFVFGDGNFLLMSYDSSNNGYPVITSGYAESDVLGHVNYYESDILKAEGIQTDIINLIASNNKVPSSLAVVNYVQAEIGTITTTLQNINTGNGV